MCLDWRVVTEEEIPFHSQYNPIQKMSQPQVEEVVFLTSRIRNHWMKRQ